MYFDTPDEDLTGSEHVAAVQRRIYFYGNTVELDCTVHYTEDSAFYTLAQFVLFIRLWIAHAFQANARHDHIPKRIFSYLTNCTVYTLPTDKTLLTFSGLMTYIYVVPHR